MLYVLCLWAMSQIKEGFKLRDDHNFLFSLIVNKLHQITRPYYSRVLYPVSKECCAYNQTYWGRDYLAPSARSVADWIELDRFVSRRIIAIQSKYTDFYSYRFINLILLPRVRDDIEEYKKLNFHLYMAVSKGLYKPAAFFKGFLLPLCDVSGDYTLKS